MVNGKINTISKESYNSDSNNEHFAIKKGTQLPLQSAGLFSYYWLVINENSTKCLINANNSYFNNVTITPNSSLNFIKDTEETIVNSNYNNCNSSCINRFGKGIWTCETTWKILKD